MKYILLTISALFLFSCEKTVKEDVKDYSKISIAMDTVVVDPGDEIINLKYGLFNNTMSEDNKFLFLWNQGETTLDKINLEELRLEKKIQFEKEGPNGVGMYMGWMSFLNEDAILMASMGKFSLFNLSGEKIREYKNTKEIFEVDSLSEDEYFLKNPIIIENGDIIYGYLGHFKDNNFVFSKADFKEKKLRRFDLEGSQELPDYKIVFITGNMGSTIGSEKSVKKAGDLIILSSSAYNRLYVLDLKKDSIYQVDYTPNLTPTGKKGGYPEKLDSEKRFKELMAEIDAEINFQPPVWDEKNRKFYRFSFETPHSETNEGPLFRSADQKPISKVYLSIFDENFNLLGETLLDELKHVPNTVFVRDGKIWIYENVDDELGFVRISINYE